MRRKARFTLALATAVAAACSVTQEAPRPQPVAEVVPTPFVAQQAPIDVDDGRDKSAVSAGGSPLKHVIVEGPNTRPKASELGQVPARLPASPMQDRQLARAAADAVAEHWKGVGAQAQGAPIRHGSQAKAKRMASQPSTTHNLVRPPPPILAPDDDTERSDGSAQESLEPTINGLVDASMDRFSTFAIDVDTGSYTLGRRFLEGGTVPDAGAVRVEEWINAFHYSYPDPASEHPFSIHMEAAPLAKQTQILRIGVQGKRVAKAERDPVHLTFLVDVSGSMQGADRLPLAQESLALLVDELGPRDSVSLVTYAGSTGVILPATAVREENKGKIKRAIFDLASGGGTNMGSGMELAYREAGKMLGEKGISRVMVLSDGDANIGRTSFQDMLRSIKGYVSEGVTLSTVGFGTGNYRDQLMEQLADAGNGNYSYVGSKKDAQRIFVDGLTGTLQVIAKDTKIQVEMNPDVVASYRLIGYENRDIADRDFRNDKVDAGEIGAGHTVTALYEVTLKEDLPTADIATVRVRYKQPHGTKATEVARAFPAAALRRDMSELSTDGRFAAGVALTAEVFRHSPHMARLGIDIGDAFRLLESGAVGPHASERQELLGLIAPFARSAAVATR